jgi:phosphoglycerate dehydrogenase-like enzyme
MIGAMKRSLALVTEPEFIRGETTFAAAEAVECLPGPADDEALAEAIRRRGARHVILGPSAYHDAIYRALPRGGVVARYGVGYDGINLAGATAAGLLCTNTPGVLHQSTAELAMLFIAAAARDLVSTVNTMKAGVWQPDSGGELEGRTLAVIGTGRIGCALARIASGGFQMRVVGCKRTASSQVVDDRWFGSLTTDFGAAVREADYVSLHIPGSPANVRFMDAERLSQLRQTAWFINTARGTVVDEVALYDALVNGRLAGAALDVFEREPYVPVDPARDLRTLPNAIVVPHVGTNTVEANRRMAGRALANIALAEAGQFSSMDLLNPDVLAVEGLRAPPRV